jgi:hypothetical protein
VRVVLSFVRFAMEWVEVSRTNESAGARGRKVPAAPRTR